MGDHIVSEDNGNNGESTETPQGQEQTGEQTEAPSIESLQAQLDEWKGHARKHEDRAKANADAAKELADLKRAQMSEDEKRSADLQAAEARVKEAETAASDALRNATRFRLAAKFGISDEDAELFLTGADEDTMTKQAEGLSARNLPGATRTNPAQGRRSGTTAPASSTRDAFAETIEGLFN